jgi:RNA polymerase sigma-70 factor (ECF subfamily)
MNPSEIAPADPVDDLARERRTEDFKDGLIREIPNLRAFAASLSGSMQLADDLVQDTLLKAWGNSDKFEPGTSLRAWLFTILRNTYYSLYRKRGREVQDSEGTYAERMATHGNQESHLDLADFRKALAKLPEEQREVLIMVGATGLSYEEAADICGVAIGTIKSRVNRARTKLAELLSIGSVDDLGPGHTNAAAMQRAGSEPVGS